MIYVPSTRPSPASLKSSDISGQPEMTWATLSKDVGDLPRRAEDRHNVEPVFENSIDDSVRRSNEFAKILPGPFGNDSARKRKLLQNVDRRHDSLNDESCVPRSVPCDEVTDGSEIPCGLGRPANRGHPRNRFLMSSCAMVSPAADCSRPRSTLARKYRRSIASSTVALSGKCSTISTIFCFSPLDAMTRRIPHGQVPAGRTAGRPSGLPLSCGRAPQATDRRFQRQGDLWNRAAPPSAAS
jgi:hypothetical protein